MSAPDPEWTSFFRFTSSIIPHFSSNLNMEIPSKLTWHVSSQEWSDMYPQSTYQSTVFKLVKKKQIDGDWELFHSLSPSLLYLSRWVRQRHISLLYFPPIFRAHPSTLAVVFVVCLWVEASSKEESLWPNFLRSNFPCLNTRKRTQSLIPSFIPNRTW